MKRRQLPEADAPPPDVILERIRLMEIKCRHRSIMTKEPAAQEAAVQLAALLAAGRADIDEALRWWQTLEWLREAP